MTTYDIIGAGSSSGNPVTVFMGCEDSVNICWTGRKTVDAYCSECYYLDSQYCQIISNVTESTTGTISWEDKSVYYEIVKNCEPEPTPQTCTDSCSDFSLYTVPGYVSLDYNGDINIYYNYTITCEGDNGYIGGKEELSGMESVPFSEFESGETVYTYDFTPLSDYPDACSGTANVYITSDEDTCDSGVTVDMTAMFTPSVVPALPVSGTDVTINVNLKKIEIDEDCSRKVTNIGYSLIWHVECDPETTDCCSDHIVSSAFTISDIRTKAGVDGDAIIRYNGVKVPSTSTKIPYSITQKAKYTDECAGGDEEKDTTYCVDGDTIKVEYETSYLSNRWTENGVVPFGGGRIRVSWTYSACTGSICSTNTWEEIIEVESCDDRQGSSDEECTYTGPDSDGGVTGSCVIYFKEQPEDGCDTCPGENPYNPELETGKYNKISYSFKQDCKSNCQKYTNIIYGTIDEETGEIKKVTVYTESPCVEDGGEDIQIDNIPYSSITEYTGVLCPEKDITPGFTSTTVHITSNNNSDSERIVFEDDMVCIIQPAGPCNSDEMCGVSVKLESGLEGTDTALLDFTDTEGTARYNANNGDIIGYYYDRVPESQNIVSVTLSSDPDNNEDYRYKFTDGTEYITGFDLACGESATTVAVKYCACKSVKKIEGETAITADGSDSITVAVYTATCEDLDVGIKYSSGDEILILNDPDNLPVFSNGVITAKVSANESTTNKRTGNYILFNKVTETDCPKNKFTVKQEKKVLPECNIEWLGGEECITCVCSENDFRLNATSISIPTEGYDDVIGTVGDCIDKVTMELVDNTWDDVRIQYADENNNIYLKVPEHAEARSETVKITYSATCGTEEDVWEKELRLSQAGGGGTCDCNSITYEGTYEEDPEPEPAIGKLYIKLGTAPSWATSGNYDIFLVKDDFTESLVNQLKEEDPTVDGTTDSEGRTYLCEYQVSNNAGTCTYVEDSLASAGLWMFYNDSGTVETTDFIEETLCWVYIREKTGQKRIVKLDNRVEFKPSSVTCNDYVMMT